LDHNPMRAWYQAPVDGKTGLPNPFAQVYRCEVCRYGQVWPLPAPGKVSDFYQLDEYYTHGQSHFADSGPVSLLDRIRVHLAWRMDRSELRSAQWLKRRLPASARTIVDIGCGSGHLAAELADAGYTVTGVEPDPKSIAQAHRGKFELISASAEDCCDALNGRRFDVVLMSHVLEHCIDPMRALTNARTLLTDRGVVHCEVPNNAAAGLRFTGASWEMFDVPRHLHFFTGDNLTEFCARALFRVTSVVYCEYTRQFSNSWIATERRIWDRLTAAPITPMPRQNSKLRAWALLLSTCLGPAKIKYDSVRVIAQAID
jgi:2-polyprenyl-3-methyl-5-hydroxy-6-metoxy-1,4-benzoquinol methylase